jgi:hypothetical protein
MAYDHHASGGEDTLKVFYRLGFFGTVHSYSFDAGHPSGRVRRIGAGERPNPKERGVPKEQGALSSAFILSQALAPREKAGPDGVRAIPPKLKLCLLLALQKD